MVPLHCFSLGFACSHKFFTIYCQIDGIGSLLDFQIEIYRCLLKADKEFDNDEDMKNPRTFHRSVKSK